jgi:hypothetical protein
MYSIAVMYLVAALSWAFVDPDRRLAAGRAE